MVATSLVSRPTAEAKLGNDDSNMGGPRSVDRSAMPGSYSGEALSKALLEPAASHSAWQERFSERVENEPLNGRVEIVTPERLTPELSIIMPAYNEQRTISRVVANILETEFPCEIELIVVNDGSSDATGEI